MRLRTVGTSQDMVKTLPLRIFGGTFSQVTLLFCSGQAVGGVVWNWRVARPFLAENHRGGALSSGDFARERGPKKRRKIDLTSERKWVLIARLPAILSLIGLSFSAVGGRWGGRLV